MDTTPGHLAARSLDRPIKLSRRQAECLAWVAEGKTAAEIGIILGLSPRTVEEYLAKACQKFGVRTRVQAAFRAQRLGLLARDD